MNSWLLEVELVGKLKNLFYSIFTIPASIMVGKMSDACFQEEQLVFKGFIQKIGFFLWL